MESALVLFFAFFFERSEIVHSQKHEVGKEIIIPKDTKIKSCFVFCMLIHETNR